MAQPSPLAALGHDARALRDSGDLDGARRLLEYALESARPSYGEDHPELLGLAEQLGRYHREADDPAAARRVLEEAFAAGERRYDDADPLMLGISFELGSVAAELGNRHEARRNLGRVAKFGPAVFGPEHPSVRAARDYLGAAAPAPEPAPAPTPAAAPPAAPQAPPPAAPPTTPDPEPRPPSAGQAFRGPAPGAYPAVPVTDLVGPPTGPPHPGGPFIQSGLERRPGTPGPGGEPPRPYPVVESFPANEPGRIGGSPGAGAPYPVILPERTGRGRAPMIVAVVAAGVAALSATVAAVAVFRDDDPAPPLVTPTATAAGPELGGDPPTGVRVRDDGTAITVTWEDPGTGTVPFIVAGGRSGQQLRAMATVSPGETSHTVNGLNPRLDYCFTVLAVYSTDRYATSGQVCTSRSTPTPG